MCDVCCADSFGCISRFFFFKQKTADEMRISDWSSDVCSSDLLSGIVAFGHHADQRFGARRTDDEPPAPVERRLALGDRGDDMLVVERLAAGEADIQIGRAHV